METLAILSVLIGILSSAIIAVDLLKHKQSMKIMNSVWILTALWAGILGLIAYFWFGRAKKAMKMSMTMPKIAMPNDGKMTMKMDGMMKMDMPERPKWQSTTLSTLHCGAGCTLADLIGEWFLFFVAIRICESLVVGSMVVDYILALCIGVYFQAAAIKSMDSTLTIKERFVKAFKADVLSLTSWQIGMYGFMAVVFYVIFPYEHIAQDSWVFWFMMQIAMLFGFLFAYPANIVLIHAGIKKSM